MDFIIFCIKFFAVCFALMVLVFLFLVLLWLAIAHQLPIAIGIFVGLFVYGMYLIITGDIWV